MIDVLGVAMGIDMQGFSRPEGSDELPPGATPSSPPKSPPPQKHKASPSSDQKAESKPVPEDVEMVDDEEAQAKKNAEAAKKLGGEAYKQRNFDEAIKQYEKAWELWPKDITILTNAGGGCFQPTPGVL